MATTSIISYGVQAASGKHRTLPVYVPSAATAANILAWIAQNAPLLDAAIGGVIDECLVTMSFALPGGLKAVPDAGSDNDYGALLSFDADSTNYSASLWVPSWSPAGFTNGANPQVIDAGAYAAFIADIVGGAGTHASDKYGNDLVTYLTGKRSFRK